MIIKNTVDCAASFIVSTYKSNITSITGWGTGKTFGDRMKGYVESYLQPAGYCTKVNPVLPISN